MTLTKEQINLLKYKRKWHQLMIKTIDEKLKQISKEHQKIISME